jgi:hypothetical protein
MAAEGNDLELALADDDGQLPLDIAWRYEFDEGEFRVTWGAMAAYELKPILSVKPANSGGIFAPKIWKANLPGISINLVAPDEYKEALEIYNEEKIHVNGQTHFTHAGRMDALLNLDVTNSETKASQLDKFKKVFGDEWEGVWQEYADRPDYLSYLASHAVARASGSIAKVSMRGFFLDMLGNIPTESFQDVDNRLVVWPMDDIFGSNVANVIHDLFCDEVDGPI